MELFSEEDVRTALRPEVGDVIVCEAFARGWRYYRRGKNDELEAPVGPIRVMDVPIEVNEQHYDCRDDSRGQAKFVVEESHPSDRKISWSNDGRIYTNEPRYLSEQGWFVRARRLRDDGIYDPAGEIVGFTTYSTRQAQDIVRETNEKALKEGWTNPAQVDRLVETPIRVVGKMKRTVHFE
ncbi:MAG: hypothetical protein U9Q03_06160 [Patescibacteria group bacterium]|nr:hypothetical protein [Patescibacteria group bacterium]